jgi:DNA repair exonuclease SbcCD ATPase subunit
MIVVEKVVSENFMGHRSVEVELPPKGIVVITGNNGSGKSTLIEAVGASLWARLLRGTKWQPDIEARLGLTSSAVALSRVRKGRHRELTWAPPGVAAAQYGTESKAQEALEAVVGSFDQWRRSSVFSSADLDTFTRATDAERKRLLETMIGVDVFDGALSSCRGDLRSAKTKLLSVSGRMRELEAKIEGYRRQDEEAQIGAGPEPARPDKDEQENKEREVAKLAQDHRALINRESATANDLRNATLRLKRSESELSTLDQTKECSKCGQRLDKAAKARLGQGAKETRKEAQGAILVAEETLDDVVAERESLEKELHTLKNELDVLRHRAHDHSQWESRRRLRDDRREKIAEALRSLENDLLDVEDEIDESSGEVSELEVVERVLGLQGVRAHIVARTLSGVQDVANVWVRRLLPGASVELRPDTELKRGGTVDRISLDVHGVGHNDGYMGCSGGERRRLDVALLLALAEVQAGAVGGPPGSLFLDEVFDTLDADGKAAVSSALSDISMERAVIVITHSNRLAASLEASRHIVFDNGAVASYS